MQPKKSDRLRDPFCPDLIDKLDPRNHLLELVKSIPWQFYEDDFRPLYATTGRPANPFCFLNESLILKQLENLSDERVVETWRQPSYFQALCGQQRFTWKRSCNPSGLKYLLRRIGKIGVRKIFKVSVPPDSDMATEEDMVMDTTVQEKNITLHTNTNLLTQIVTRCRIMTKREDAKLRNSYQREVTKLARIIRFKPKGRKKDEVQRAIRRLQTTAGLLIHKMRRLFLPEALEAHPQSLDRYERAQRQQRYDTCKIFSIHEPDASCISKGETHKKYEFAVKASITATKTSGTIFSPPSIPDNLFDDNPLSQVESFVGKRPSIATRDHNYRDKCTITHTHSDTPKPDNSPKTEHKKRPAWALFLRRCVIKPIICQLKNAHRMLGNYFRPNRRFSKPVYGLHSLQLPEVNPNTVFIYHKLLRHFLEPNFCSSQALA